MASLAETVTEAQLAALTLIFLLRNTRNHGVVSRQTLGQYIKEYLCPFLEVAARSNADFLHLVYLGCGTISIGSMTVQQWIKGNYPWLLYAGFTEEQALGLLDGAQPAVALFRKWEDDDSRFVLAAGTRENFVEAAVTKAVISESLAAKIFDAQNKKLLPDKEAARIVAESHVDGDGLVQWYEQTPAKSFNITSVGIALAWANIKVKTGVEMDLSIWL